ncbi:MAG: O-succinylbenzoic acid--CoA ligase, partial [Bacteroidota bacterium]
QNRFFISSENDKDLGQKVILIIEADDNTLEDSVFSGLEKFEVPKKIYNTPQFIETETRKVQRQKTYNKVMG